MPPSYPGKAQIDLPIELSGRDRDLLDCAVVQTSITTPAGAAPWNGVLELDGAHRTRVRR